MGYELRGPKTDGVTGQHRWHLSIVRATTHMYIGRGSQNHRLYALISPRRQESFDNRIIESRKRPDGVPASK